MDEHEENVQEILCGGYLSARAERFELCHYFHMFIYGIGKKGVRHRLPKCCVDWTRSMFPTDDGTYTGFIAADTSVETDSSVENEL